MAISGTDLLEVPAIRSMYRLKFRGYSKKLSGFISCSTEVEVPEIAIIPKAIWIHLFPKGTQGNVMECNAYAADDNLVGGFRHCLICVTIFGMLMPNYEHIFIRWVETTNQHIRTT